MDVRSLQGGHEEPEGYPGRRGGRLLHVRRSGADLQAGARLPGGPAQHMGRARLHGKAQHGRRGRLPDQHGRWPGYPETIEYNLGARVDYGMVVKEFRQDSGEELRRYAPPRLLRAEKIAVYGRPE